MDIKLVLSSSRYMPLFYFSSARPRVQQTVIKNTLNEPGEPALHRSVSQPTAHSSASHLVSSLALHNNSLLQELTTPVPSPFLAQALMHLSIPDAQVTSLLLLSFQFILWAGFLRAKALIISTWGQKLEWNLRENETLQGKQTDK